MAVETVSPGGGRIVTRNLVKVLPWQLGHLGTMGLFTGEATSQQRGGRHLEITD